MSKGGGGGGVNPTPTKSTVTQTSLPEYAQPYYERLLTRGETVTDQPYLGYPGPRIAPFAPEQSLGFGLQTQAGATAPQGMYAAQDYYSNILNRPYAPPPPAGEVGAPPQAPVGGAEGPSPAAGFGPRPFQAQGYSGLIGEYRPSYDYKDYFDPYLEDVLGGQRRSAETQFGLQAQQREAARVGRGTRTGSRAAVEESLARGQFEERMGDLESRQRSEGFRLAQQQAMDQFQRDRAARVQAAQLGGAERLQEAQYGLQAAAAAAGMDPQILQQQLSQAGALQGVGAAYQKMDQANLDLAYQDFLNQRDFERRQLQFLAGLLQGVPVTPQSEVYQYQAPGSFTGQLAGAGLGALGAYKTLTG